MPPKEKDGSNGSLGGVSTPGRHAEQIITVEEGPLDCENVLSSGRETPTAPDGPGEMITPEVPLTPSHRARIHTLPELLGLFAISFSYAFVFNTVNNIVIPKEIERLSPTRQSFLVGVTMAAGAFSQLATPVVGAWSDRTGQRTPFLIYGTFLVIIGIVIFLVVATTNTMILLIVAHIVTTVGLSVQYSMLTALLHDQVADEQVGRGSGAMAILAILGSGCGYLMFATNIPLHFSYSAYILATVICLGMTVMHIPGSHTDHLTHHAWSGRPRRQRCADVLTSLSIPSATRYPDFFFACAGRALFNTGLAGQVYLVYYFRDVLRAPNPIQLSSTIAVMALVGGVVGALPAGIYSDRVGKKPVIYISVGVCVVALILFMSTYNITYLQLVGFIYGVGNVAYLSVDYALGVNSLPRKKEGSRWVPIDAAKDLGVFAMSATIGQLFGQVVYGTLLDQFNVAAATGGTRYSHSGFIVIYALGVLAFFLSAASTHFIRGVR